MSVGLPIQCAEAVFLALYLSHPAPDFPGHGVWPDLAAGCWRVNLRFKSALAGDMSTTHRHMVLAVRFSDGKWGALGTSRRANLMDKPPAFPSLHALVREFALAYRDVGHVLLKVYLSMPFPDDEPSHNALHWRTAAVRLPPAMLPPAHLPLHTHTPTASYWDDVAVPVLMHFEASIPSLLQRRATRGRGDSTRFRTPHPQLRQSTQDGTSSSSDDESGIDPPLRPSTGASDHGHEMQEASVKKPSIGGV